MSNKAPSESLLATLGVLRRPATAADRLPRELRRNIAARGIYESYIRRARVSDGISYYIVPAKSVSPRVSVPASPARCFFAIGVALDRELRHAPAKLRAPTKALLTHMIASERAFPETGDGICLAFANSNSSGDACGETAAELERHGLISPVGPLSGVVPDGVASVTVRYPTKSGQVRTATTDVVGNVFAFSPRSLRSFPSVGHSVTYHSWPTLVWRSSQGKILKVVPTGGSLGLSNAFCSGGPRINLCAR